MARRRSSTRVIRGEEGSIAGQAVDNENLPTHPNAPRKATSRRDVPNSFVSRGGTEGHPGWRKGRGRGKAARRAKSLPKPS